MNMKDVKTIITSGVLIVAFALYYFFGDGPPKPTDELVVNEEITISLHDVKAATEKAEREVQFVSVNDGDTFKVMLKGKEQRVRLLMVDTPEMNYNKGEPMLYAEEAKALTEQLLKNAEKIELVFDKGQETDDYGRLLAYVFVDGKLLQEALLQEGLAVVRYIYPPNNSLEKQFRAIEVIAEKQQKNIWSKDGYYKDGLFHEEAVN